MAKQKAVIRLGVPNDKNRSKAMQLASQFHGVNSVGITGAGKDQLEVVGEGIDIPRLATLLRKRVFCAADIVLVEEVKDKAKQEEEKKKKAAEEKKKKEEEERKAAEEALKKLGGTYPPSCYGGYYGGPPPTYLCEEQPAAGCHIM